MLKSVILLIYLLSTILYSQSSPEQGFPSVQAERFQLPWMQHQEKLDFLTKGKRINPPDQLQQAEDNLIPHLDPQTIWGHQQVVWDWENKFQSAQQKTYAEAHSITVDPNGYPITTGKISNGYNGFDMRTQKFSPAGLLIWEDIYNGPANGDDYGTFVQLDADGNTYAAGMSKGSDGYNHLVVIKYDSQGNRLWLRNILAFESRYSELVSACLLNEGGMYLLISDLNWKNIPLIVKLNSNGEIEWQIQSEQYWYPLPISNFVRDGQENFYLATFTSSDTITLHKYSAEGDRMWQQSWALLNSGYSNTLRLSSTPDQDIVVTWAMAHSASDPGGLGIRLYTDSGQSLWQQEISGDFQSAAMPIRSDTSFIVMGTQRQGYGQNLDIVLLDLSDKGEFLRQFKYSYQTLSGYLKLQPELILLQKNIYGVVHESGSNHSLFLIDETGTLDLILSHSTIKRPDYYISPAPNLFVNSTGLSYLCGLWAANEAIISINHPNPDPADRLISSPGAAYFKNKLLVLESDPQGNIFSAVNDHDLLYLQKMDKQGNLLWKNELLDLNRSYQELLAFDRLGNFYLSFQKLGLHYVMKFDEQGNICGQSEFPYNTSGWSDQKYKVAANGNQILVSRNYSETDSSFYHTLSVHFFNKNAQLLAKYEQQFPDGIFFFINDIALDEAGSAYLSLNIEDGPDLTIKKISPQGQELWSYDYNSNLNFYRAYLMVDKWGNCYSANAELDFEPTTTRISLVKLNRYGQKILETYLLEFADYFWNLQYLIDHRNNLVIAAPWRKQNSDRDCYIYKFSPEGKLNWETHYDVYGSNEYIDLLKIDAANNIYVHGSAYNLSGGRELFTAKFDQNGNLRWAQTSTSNSVEKAESAGLCIQSDGKVIVGEQTATWDWSYSRIIAYAQTDSDQVTITNQVRLQQNTPNPFNNQSSIRYEMPQAEKVSFRIFNSLGQEVQYKNLGLQSAGTHYFHLNAGQWASGVYFYQLKTGKSVKTKKMVLVH